MEYSVIIERILNNPKILSNRSNLVFKYCQDNGIEDSDITLFLFKLRDEELIKLSIYTIHKIIQEKNLLVIFDTKNNKIYVR